MHDGCRLARTSLVTGSIHGIERAQGSDGLWVVNALFSCLCTLNDAFNFVPRWRPPYVSIAGRDGIDSVSGGVNGMNSVLRPVRLSAAS